MFACSFLAGAPIGDISGFDGVEANLSRWGIVWDGSNYWGVQPASKIVTQYDSLWAPTGVSIDTSADFTSNALASITTDETHLYIAGGVNANTIPVGKYTKSGSFVASWSTPVFPTSATRGIAYNPNTGKLTCLGTSGNWYETTTTGSPGDSGQIPGSSYFGIVWDKVRGCYWVGTDTGGEVKRFNQELSTSSYTLDISNIQTDMRGVCMHPNNKSLLISGTSPAQITKWT